MPKATIMPLSRIIWKEEHVDKASLFKQLARECAESEILTVANKLRDCTTMQINSQDFVKYSADLAEKNLIFLPIKTVRAVTGFAHKFYNPIPGEPSNIYGVISHSFEKAKEFVKASTGKATDHEKIGYLLGYPKCCIDFFTKYWLAGEVDPIFLEAQMTKGVKVIKENILEVKAFPEINVALRYFSLRVTPHLPCSFSCEKSREFAKLFLQFIPSKENILEFLSTPFEWNAYKGAAIINTQWFRGIVNSMSWDDDNPRIVKFI